MNAPQQPRLPDGQIIYAIGDLHGRSDLLERMLIRIQEDAANHPAEQRTIVYLGDYVDRGHDTRGVIERLIEGPPDGFEQVCLMGNHESWLLDFLDSAHAGAGWFMNGGVATLASYGVLFSHGGNRMDRLEDARAAFAEALPPEHFSFLDGLGYLWRAGDYVFVHAGVRPGVPLGDQDPEDMVWIRDEFLESSADFGAVIVHGHTIRDFPEERANRIGIDTGAFATGCLTCLCLDGEKRDFIQT